MKKIYTMIVAALVCSVPGNAQFTMLQRYHQPSAVTGHSQADLVEYDSLAVLNNSTGQSQTWDFSQMKITSNIHTQSFVVPNMQSADSLFAGTNLKGMEAGGSASYYKIDSVTGKTFELLGYAQGTMNTVFSDPKTLLKFDINYGTTFSDTYAFTEDSTTITGTYSVTATGSGDLQLVGGPGKVFPKTMQLTAWDNLTMHSSTDTMTAQIKTYYYYHESNRYPLLIVSYTTFDTITMGTIYVNYLEAVGVTENNLNASYAIYPNPATTHFAVKLTNEGGKPCEVKIQSITGELVKTIDLGTEADINTTIEVGDLQKGIYLVTTRSGIRTGTRKLIIE